MVIGFVVYRCLVFVGLIMKNDFCKDNKIILNYNISINILFLKYYEE